MEYLSKILRGFYAPSYNMDVLWIVVVGFIVAFFMAFNVGANDVANSFGPVVGSKVLSLKWACLLAVIFESLGAVLLGTKVSDSVWKEMVDISVYRGQEKILLFGYVSSLLGATIWICMGTIFKIPISGTHAIIAATVGFSLVKHGSTGIYWFRVVRIVASWFISPIFAGTVSGALFVLVRRYILDAPDPLQSALKATPFFYALTVFINVTSIFMYGTIIPGLVEKIPWWGVLSISSALGLITGLSVHFFYIPWQKRRVAIHSSALRMGDTVLTRVTIRSEISSTVIGTIEETPDQLEAMINSAPADLHTQGVFRVSNIPIAKRSSRRGSSSSRHKLRESASLHAVSEVERSEFLAAINIMEEHVTPVASAVIPETEEIQNTLVIAPGVVSHQRPSVESCNLCPSCPLNFKRFAAKEILGPLPDQPNKNEIRRPRVKLADAENPDIAPIFAALQIVTAAFTAFGHGGNDVSNAVGPLLGIWTIFTNERFLDQTRTPMWLLCFGAFGISCGLCILGRRVMETVGTTLTTVLPSCGFCIGLGTAFTVLIASEIGLPISTTHCIVGSVITVGWLRCRTQVNWRLLWKIILGWGVTMPIAAGCSAGIMALLSLVFL